MEPTPEGGAEQEVSPADESAVDSAQQTSAVVVHQDWNTFAPALRARLADLAAAALGDMPAVDVPSRLRPVVRFAPAKRAKLGQAPLLAALRESTVFRAAVVDWGRTHRPEAVRPHTDDAVAAAAAAVLLDDGSAPHYVELVALRHEQNQQRSERDAAVAKADKLAAEVERLRHDLAEARHVADHAGDERSAEADRLRKRLREQGTRLREAKDAAEEARAEVERVRVERESAIQDLTADRDRERARAQEERQRAERAASEVSVARQSAREARKGNEVRLSLLLDTMEGAVSGLRRELGTTGQGPRPADTVRGVHSVAGSTGEVQDAAALERLLGLPSVHLVVDGYNVTKTGYPDLPLADQRDRLSHQLAALAARTGAEVTVVFDGADVLSVPGAGPRGVRVLFSEPGVQADDVIRALVRAEPQGRQVVVATSDRAVVTSVRQNGAYPVASAILLTRLTRL